MEYQVISIKELNGRRRLVCINYEPEFALYLGELKKYNIVENGIVPEAVYRELEAVLCKRAVMRAMNLLKSKDYTEKELMDKLRASYYPQMAIDNALEYVKSYGYVNDRRYAANYVMFKAESRSRHQIVGFLKQKGISSDIIQSVCEEYYGDNSEAEYEVLLKQMSKKLSKYDEQPGFEARQKIKSYFYRKGFSTEIIGKTLDVVVERRYNNNLM